MLSDVSRSTKGVVILLSDGAATKRVMEEAHKLNMVEGNFVWLWIDTSAAVTARNDSKLSIFFPPAEEYSKYKDRRIRESGDSDSDNSYFNLVIKYFTEERITKNDVSSNSSGSENNNGNETSDTSELVFNTSRVNSLINIALSNKTDLSSTLGELNTTTNGRSVKDELETTTSTSSVNITDLSDRLNNNTENTSIRHFKLVSNFDSSHKSLSVLRNTTITNDYVWVQNVRKSRNGVTFLPKDQTIDRAHNSQPLNLHGTSNSSILLGIIHNSPSGDDSSRQRGRKSTRSAKISDRGDTVSKVPPLPVGLLGIRAIPLRFDRQVVRSTVRLLVDAMRRAVFHKCRLKESLPVIPVPRPPTCWLTTPEWQKSFARHLVQ